MALKKDGGHASAQEVRPRTWQFSGDTIERSVWQPRKNFAPKGVWRAGANFEIGKFGVSVFARFGWRQ